MPGFPALSEAEFMCYIILLQSLREIGAHRRRCRGSESGASRGMRQQWVPGLRVRGLGPWKISGMGAARSELLAARSGGVAPESSVWPVRTQRLFEPMPECSCETGSASARPLVPLAGLEPARVLAHLILSQARLPVPPQGQGGAEYSGGR